MAPPTSTTPEREMLAVYDEWGRWRYLAYWFEMWLKEPGA